MTNDKIHSEINELWEKTSELYNRIFVEAPAPFDMSNEQFIAFEKTTSSLAGAIRELREASKNWSEFILETNKKEA